MGHKVKIPSITATGTIVSPGNEESEESAVSHKPNKHRDQARLDGLRQLFRKSSAEATDASDEILSEWLVRRSARGDQILAHKLRRDLEAMSKVLSSPHLPRRAAE